jgi:predicted dehydrogenase
MGTTYIPSMPAVAVIGCGYWGKNLVRNFYHLGALAMVCDSTAAGARGGKADRAERSGRCQPR